MAEAAASGHLRETPLAAAAPRARRPHGAVRRLRDAGAVPDRHHRRAHVDARRRPGCSTSPIWARPSCARDRTDVDADHGASRHRRDAGPGDIVGLEPGPAPLHAADQRRGRHHRRPDGHAAGRPGEDGVLLHRRQCRRARRSTSPISARGRRRARAAARRRPRAARAAGARGRAEVIARHCPACRGLAFMTLRRRVRPASSCHVSRSGYTGEDGFEISVPPELAEAFVGAAPRRAERCKPIGLGARDSLRLEAGLLPLWPRHRRDDLAGRGRSRLRDRQAPPRRGRLPRRRARPPRARATGPRRKRVGLDARRQGAGPRRHRDQATSRGRRIGIVTSGGYGADVGGPIAMGYVEPAFAAPGTKLALDVRGKALPAHRRRTAFRPPPLCAQTA